MMVRVLSEVIHEVEHIEEIGACSELSLISTWVRGADQQPKVIGDQVVDNGLLDVAAVREPLFGFGRDLLVMRTDGFRSPTERSHIRKDESVGLCHGVVKTQM
jgi:hypothetical protein